MTRRARSTGHLVTRLLLSPVLGNWLVSIAWVVSVLRWGVSHRLLVLPRTSHGLHRLHGDGVSHVRGARLLRTALRVAVELLVRWLRTDPGSLTLVTRRRTLRLKRPSTGVVRGA